jgi:RNA polymerase sigma-70 factor (ECF subfamily)
MKELFDYRFFLLKLAKQNLGPSLESWAEDMVQETFLKASKNIHSYNESKGQLSTWLGRITINLCRDFAKKRVNKEVCVERFLWEENSFCEEKNETFKDIRPHLNKLSSRYKQVLILKYRFELSAKEMAVYLDMPASQVPILTMRARQSLLKQLTDAESLRKNAA